VVGAGHDLPVVADGVREPEFDAIVAFCDPQNQGYVTRNAFIAYMTQKNSAKAQSASDILNAFAMIAEDKPYVTEAQLKYGRTLARVRYERNVAAALTCGLCGTARAKLTPDQVAYCLQHMQQVPNNPGHYDYKAFAQTVRVCTGAFTAARCVCVCVCVCVGGLTHGQCSALGSSSPRKPSAARVRAHRASMRKSWALRGPTVSPATSRATALVCVRAVKRWVADAGATTLGRSQKDAQKAKTVEQKQAAEQARASEKAALKREREDVAGVSKQQSEAVKQQEELRLKAEEEVQRRWFMVPMCVCAQHRAAFLGTVATEARRRGQAAA
jgi:hypothetical protein